MKHLLKVIQFFKLLKVSDQEAVSSLIKEADNNYIEKITKQILITDLMFNDYLKYTKSEVCPFCFEALYKSVTPPIIINLNDKYFYIKPAKKEILTKHIEICNMSHTEGTFDINVLEKISSFFPSFMIIYSNNSHEHFNLGLIDAPILNRDASISFNNVYIIDWYLETYLIKEKDLDDLIDEYNSLNKKIENKNKTYLFFKRGNKFHLYIVIHKDTILSFEAIGLFDINNNFSINQNYMNAISKLN